MRGLDSSVLLFRLFFSLLDAHHRDDDKEVNSESAAAEAVAWRPWSGRPSRVSRFPLRIGDSPYSLAKFCLRVDCVVGQVARVAHDKKHTRACTPFFFYATRENIDTSIDAFNPSILAGMELLPAIEARNQIPVGARIRGTDTLASNSISSLEKYHQNPSD